MEHFRALNITNHPSRHLRNINITVQRVKQNKKNLGIHYYKNSLKKKERLASKEKGPLEH